MRFTDMLGASSHLGGSSGSNLATYSLFESLLQMPGVATTLTVMAIGITLALWRNIWAVHRERSVVAKIGWTVVTCVPLAGWVLYGGLGVVPSPHRSQPQHWESDGLG